MDGDPACISRKCFNSDPHEPARAEVDTHPNHPNTTEDVFIAEESKDEVQIWKLGKIVVMEMEESTNYRTKG